MDHLIYVSCLCFCCCFQLK
uniref:Uncharacterized protein n=1 Tax=Rhizophora mucronata TaxID=61149 RepID=A0A2P2NX94_RHIMU